MTSVFWRNPEYYIKEILELREVNLAYDRGYCVKRNMDAQKWASLWYPPDLEYRLLLVGNQGTPELDRTHTLAKPKAVYPTWCYGEDFDELEDLIANPVGMNEEMCADQRIPADERPVLHQEHRVIVSDLPGANTGPARRLFKFLKELQEDYYTCIIHIHGLYGFRTMFSNDFGAVDYDPRILAKKGKVVLGSGKEMTYEQAARLLQWVNVVGMRPADLLVPRNRCIFNMKSALWAAEHFTQNIKFKSSGYHKVDPDALVELSPTTGAIHTRSLPVQSGDKFLCDQCSLQDSCKYFRVGEVCSIPDSEPSGLARMFKTRNADTIIDGLGSVLAVQTERLKRGVDEEEEYGELDPEVTRIVNSIMTHGNKLAKLLNPALNGGPKVGVFVGAGAQVTAAPDPKQITANVVRALEEQGIPRNKITPEMIMGMLGQGDPQQTAIDVQSQEAS